MHAVRMTEWIMLIVFGIASPILMLYLAVPLVWRALRTGELHARGRSYFRTQQPRRFWSGVVFWIAIMALFAFTAIVMFWRFFKSS